MGDQKIDFTTGYSERIASNEAKVKEIEKKVNDLSEIKETLAVLATIQKEMIDDNKIRDKERKESAKAMSELSVSVKQTTDAVSKLNAKMDSTDRKLDEFIDDRTERMENKKSKRTFIVGVVTCLLSSATAILVALLK